MKSGAIIRTGSCVVDNIAAYGGLAIITVVDGRIGLLEDSYDIGIYCYFNNGVVVTNCDTLVVKGSGSVAGTDGPYDLSLPSGLGRRLLSLLCLTL